MQRAVGASENGLVVDDLFPVEDDGDVAVDQCDVVAVPFAARLACVFRRQDAPEDSADALDALHAAIAVEHLRLVDPTQVDAAVPSRRHLEFNLKVEVQELPLGAQVAKARVRREIEFLGGVDQLPFDRLPAVDLLGVGELPTVEIASVEKPDGLAE